MAEPQGFNVTQVSGKKLDDVKFDRSKDVVGVIIRLCKESKREDYDVIVNRIVDDLNQIFIAGEEIGRRKEHDKLTRKLPK